MDPMTIATLGSLALQGIGSAVSGIAAGKASAEDRKAAAEAQRRQLGQSYQQMGMTDRQYGQQSNMDRSRYLDERGVAAADLRRRQNLAPLSDQASAMLAARVGAAPAAFQARDYTRGTTPGAGQATGGFASTLGAQRQTASTYQPGQGGLMNNPELQSALARLSSMAGVPGEYTPMSAQQMGMQAEIDDQRRQMAMDNRPAERAKYSQRINDMLKFMNQPYRESMYVSGAPGAGAGAGGETGGAGGTGGRTYTGTGGFTLPGMPRGYR